MFFRKRKPDPTINEDEFEDVVSRLRAERREATPLELDQIKMRALNQAHRSASGPRARGVDVRRTLVVLITTFSLMAGGTGAVIAGNGNDKSKGKDDKDKGDKKDKDKGDKNAGKSQYSQCKNSGGNGSSSSNQNASSQQQNCPPPPPQSQGSHGNGSHQSHQNQGSHGNDH